MNASRVRAPAWPSFAWRMWAWRALASVILLALSLRSAQAFELVPAWTAEGDRTSARFGSSVAPAGDVNGDGFGDLLIGAPGAISGRGQALLYLSSASGLASTSQWLVQGALPGADLGRSVAAAGDLNGDGFADLLVGVSREADDSDNAGGVFLYLGSANGPSTQAFWSIEGDQSEEGLGSRVADAGDVDDDGFRDLLVAAPTHDAGETDEGRVYLYAGSASGYATTPAWFFDSNEADGGLGRALSGGLDVNADGYSDAWIGAPGSANGGGAAYLFLGSSAGFAGTPNATIIRPEPGFARAVAMIGDVNGDGYVDLAAGAPDASDDQANEGLVVVYYGSPTGIDDVPDWQARGNAVDARFGTTLQSAGDVNGDGYADLLVGSPLAGRAWLFLGGANGLSAAPDWSLDQEQVLSAFGAAVSGVGDVNNDGFSDLLIGAPDLDNGQSNEGRAYLFLGHGEGPAAVARMSTTWPANDEAGTAVAGAGDVNGDGYADFVSGAPGTSSPEATEGRAYLFLGPSGTQAWSYDGGQVGARFGVAVSSAGDVNNDGFTDVLVGAPGGAGAAYAFLGKPNGLSTTPGWSVTGSGANAALGRSLAAAGDVNGDGFCDVLVSANASEARLYLGSGSGIHATPGWIASVPAAGDWRDLLVVGPGDVNRDGMSDVLLVARRYSGEAPDAGGAFLYLGSASGPGETPWWSEVRDEPSFGRAASAAGDLDADGFADFVIGAPDAFGDQGAVSFYFGAEQSVEQPVAELIGASGERLGAALARIGDSDGDGHGDLAITAAGVDEVRILLGHEDALDEGPILFGAAGEGFGAASAGAGDVDGDGFSDLLVGRPGASGVSLFLANDRDPSSPGRVVLARQAKRSGARMSLLGRSDSETSLRLLANGRSAAGRTDLRLEWCIDLTTSPLADLPTGRGLWIDSGAPIVGAGSTLAWNQIVTGLTTGSTYHWRLRSASRSPFFPAGPWASLAPSVASEMQCRTRGQLSTIGVEELPVARLDFGILGIAPNPASREVEVSFTLEAAHAITLSIVDAQGRRLRAWDLGPLERGEHRLRWDGRDARGHRVASGVYYLRLSAPGRSVARQLVWR